MDIRRRRHTDQDRRLEDLDVGALFRRVHVLLLDLQPIGSLCGRPDAHSSSASATSSSGSEIYSVRPPAKRDAQVGRAMARAVGAVAARPSEAKRTHDDTASESLLEGRELREDPLWAVAIARHHLLLFICETIALQLTLGAPLTGMRQVLELAAVPANYPALGLGPLSASRWIC